MAKHGVNVQISGKTQYTKGGALPEEERRALGLDIMLEDEYPPDEDPSQGDLDELHDTAEPPLVGTLAWSCGGCPFWQGFAREGAGQCRIRPPVAYLAEDGQVTTVFPMTRPHDWCGEHPRRR